MAKSTFTETIRIEASIQDVWAILADVGGIADWNPGLIGSQTTNDIQGLGAARHCIIDARHNLDEEVVHFEPEHAITFRITRSTLPIQSADIKFALAGAGKQTDVSVSPSYRLKYGVFGRLIDAMIVSKAYRRGMRDLLWGLKVHAEDRGFPRRPGFGRHPAHAV